MTMKAGIVLAVLFGRLHAMEGNGQGYSEGRRKIGKVGG
jgi:hypothetical protein